MMAAAGKSRLPRLGVHLNIAGDSPTEKAIGEALGRAMELGVSVLPVVTRWNEVEPAPGDRHVEGVDDAGFRSYRRERGLACYYHVQSPLNMFSRSVPEDLGAALIGAPEFRDRFVEFLLELLEAVQPAADFKLALGNEINTYLALNPAELEPLAELMREVRAALRTHYPAAMLGTTFAFQSGDVLGPIVEALRSSLDWVGMQLYAYGRNPFGGPDFRPGRGDARVALDEMVGIVDGLPVLLTEFGMPTSPVLQGSEELQAAFVSELWTELVKRVEQFEAACWWPLHDFTNDGVDMLMREFFTGVGEVTEGTDFREYIRSGGLYTATGQPKAAAHVLAQMVGGVP